MRLQNKVAIITGAGSGIGRGMALTFAREGAKMVLADWSDEGGKETVGLVEAQGGEAVFVKTDVSKAGDVEEMVKTCVDHFGRVDILVNNAGIVKFGALHETPEEDWDAVIDVNLKSIFLTTKRVIPEMLKAGKGKIVNIASIAGLVGFDQIAPYCASKGGIIAFTRATALEYAKSKININCIAPGVIKTAMTKDMLASEESKKGYESQTPYPRLGEPEDIAEATVYLSADESDFVTGQVLTVDGGWTIK